MRIFAFGLAFAGVMSNGVCFHETSVIVVVSFPDVLEPMVW